jgi:hypothetical protein
MRSTGPPNVPPFSRGRIRNYVGIDWSDRKHDVCIRVPGQAKPERLVIEHRAEAIQSWAEQLRSRFGGAPVAVSVELQEGPIVWALLEHDFIVMFPVKPTTVARYRSAFRPSGAKDDPTDAEVILELLMGHRDKLERLQPERAAVRQLRRLVELRRDLVHDRTRLTNRITDALKAYFPQVLGWFADKEAAVFADFLERWPTLQHAQRARPGTLRGFFHASNVRRASTIEKRLEAIRSERPLHDDAAVIGSGPAKPSRAAAGRKRFTNPTHPAAGAIKPPCAPWLSNGSASCSAAGATAWR